MPSNSSDFIQILNIAPSGHMQTIHKIIKDTSPCKEHQNPPKLHQELPQRLMTFLEFLLELMMILMFLTGAGVLDDVLDGLHMP